MKPLSHPAVAPAKTDSRYDILKFALAMMIVILHTSLYPAIFLPWVRVAVPLFFMMSSFFFFRKVNTLKSNTEANAALRKFLKRSAILYLFWTVALFIPALQDKHWFDHGFWTGLATMIYDMLFANTFRASWFIPANAIAVCIVFALRRHKAVAGAAGAVLFILCCITSNYYYAFPTVSKQLCAILFRTQYYFSFPAALLWVWLGLLAASSRRKGKPQHWILPLLAGIAMLYLEYRLVTSHRWVRDNDVYFSLAVVCPSCFMFIRSLKPFSCTATITLRHAGIIFYCTHATIANFMRLYLKEEGIKGNMAGVINFSVTLLCCVAVTSLILWLSRVKGFGWLKYSY